MFKTFMSATVFIISMVFFSFFNQVLDPLDLTTSASAATLPSPGTGGGDVPPDEEVDVRRRATELAVKLQWTEWVLKQMEVELQTALKQKEELEGANNDLKAKSEKQAKTLAELKTDKKKLKQDLTAAQKALDEAIAQIGNLQGKLKKANKKNEGLEANLAAEQSKLKKAGDEMKELNMVLNKTSAELNNAHTRIAQLENNLSETKLAALRALVGVGFIGLPLFGFVGGASGYMYANLRVPRRRQPAQEVPTRDLWEDESYRERMIQQARSLERRRRQSALALQYSQSMEDDQPQEQRDVERPVAG